MGFPPRWTVCQDPTSSIALGQSPAASCPTERSVRPGGLARHRRIRPAVIKRPAGQGGAQWTSATTRKPRRSTTGSGKFVAEHLPWVADPGAAALRAGRVRPALAGLAGAGWGSQCPTGRRNTGWWPVPDGISGARGNSPAPARRTRGKRPARNRPAGQHPDRPGFRGAEAAFPAAHPQRRASVVPGLLEPGRLRPGLSAHQGVLDGDEWVINGTKSGRQPAPPQAGSSCWRGPIPAAKHRGLSFLHVAHGPAGDGPADRQRGWALLVQRVFLTDATQRRLNVVGRVG